MPVSKTDFVRYTQCEKMLWLDAHAPEYKIIPPEVQARLDAGNEFGDKAMGIFGAFVETTAYKADGRLDYAAMIKRTQELLASGENVVCEGAFSWYGNYCAADILKKEDDGYSLYEVKNAPTVRKEFVLDLGFQRLILRKCGVNILSSHLILNGETDEKADEKATFIEKDGMRYKIVDVTAAAKRAEWQVSQNIFTAGKLKRKDAPCPCISVGEQCTTPYRCWYYEYCHGNINE